MFLKVTGWFFAVFLSLFFANDVSGQQYMVSGCLKDSVNYFPTENASIAVLRTADSVLCLFQNADSAGRFRAGLPAGKYIIIASHPHFAEYVDTFSLHADKDLGDVYMFTPSRLLEEVIIHDRSAIIIKGDTIEYNADSFKVDAYADVTELLKRLPGIEIDGRGRVIAHGAEVRKMYVDGDEFFSDDPAVVAKMLRANAIAKVQEFNSKSKKAQFSGIDDGQRVKTLNLVLKDDAKQGFWGNVRAGAGPPKYYDGGATINAFKDKRKLSSFLNLGNTSNGDALNAAGLPNSNISYTPGIEGLPHYWNTGIHYDNKWDIDHPLHLAVNSQLKRNTNETYKQIETEYTLPDNTNAGKEYTDSRSTDLAWINELKSEKQLDSFSFIAFNASWQHLENEDRLSDSLMTLDGSGGLVNSQVKSQETDGKQDAYDLGLTFGRKFRKAGRTLTFDLRSAYSTRSNTSRISSRNTLSNYATDSLDQQRRESVNRQYYLGNLTWTEPVEKHTVVELGYAFSFDQQRSRLSSYDLLSSPAAETGILDSAYSNNYNLAITSHALITRINLNFKHTSLVLGTSVEHRAYSQLNYFSNVSLHSGFTNINPEIRLNYQKGSKASVSVVYSGNAQNPALSQIQPLNLSSDPINIYLANPGLKSQFNHLLTVNLNLVNPLKGNVFLLGGTWNVINNAITSSLLVDSLGRLLTKFINTDGNYNGTVFINEGFRIKPLKTHINAKLSYNVYRSTTIVNEWDNILKGKTYAFDITAAYRSKSAFYISNSCNISYNTSVNSIQSGATNNFISYQQNITAGTTVGGVCRVSTSALWTLRQKAFPGDDNNNLVNWNASVDYALLKDRSLNLALAVFNILNNNAGFTRTVSNGLIVTNNFNTIRRFGLLTLTWNFTHHNKDQTGHDE